MNHVIMASGLRLRPSLPPNFRSSIVAHSLRTLRCFHTRAARTVKPRRHIAAASSKGLDPGTGALNMVPAHETMFPTPETLALIEESTQHIEDMVSDILTATSTEKITALITGAVHGHTHDAWHLVIVQGRLPTLVKARLFATRCQAAWRCSTTCL